MTGIHWATIFSVASVYVVGGVIVLVVFATRGKRNG